MSYRCFKKIFSLILVVLMLIGGIPALAANDIKMVTNDNDIVNELTQIEKQKKYVVWVQEFSKKIVTIVFIMFVIFSFAELGLIYLRPKPFFKLCRLSIFNCPKTNFAQFSPALSASFETLSTISCT